MIESNIPDQSSNLLESALQYAKRGYHVFPCHNIKENGQCSCEKGDCKSPGKHPATKNGYHDATTNEATIRAWWGNTPDRNIGISTGKISGIFVVDVDTNVKKGKQGAQSLRALTDAHGDAWLDTLQAQSGSGGTHYLFKYPESVERVPSRNDAFGLHVDCKADGGYIVAAPSNHLEGTYTWLNDREPAEAPGWLLARVEEQKSPTPRVPRAAEGANPYTIKRLEAALGWVKADVYDVWVHVGMALKTGGLPLERWIEWSQRSAKFTEGECEAKWFGFTREEPNRVTLGTIFHLAKEAGWRGAGEWCPEELDEAQRTLTEALTTLTHRATNGEDVRRAALGALKAHCFALQALIEQRRGEYKITIEKPFLRLLDFRQRDFRAAVKQAVGEAAMAQATTLEGPDEGSKRSQWLRNFVLLLTDNCYADLRDGGIVSSCVFGKVAENAFPGAWEDASATKWFDQEQNMHVRHDCYYPGEPRIVKKESTIGVVEPLLNTYNAPEWPEPQYDAGLEALFLDHLMYVCGDETEFVQYLLNWMSYLIQQPGKRVNSVPLIIGPKGNGKSFIADVMTVLLGKSNVSVLNNDDLSGSFQDGLGFKQLLVLEEFKVFEGQNTMLERFKPWVTNDRVGMNRKGLKKITIDNVANTIAFSNHEDAIRIDKEERRYAVAISREPVKSQEYYTKLFSTFIPKHGGSVASILYLLKNRDVPQFNPYAPAVHTESRDRMIENTWSAEVRALWQMVLDGTNGMDAELVTFQQIESAHNTARIIAGGTSSRGVTSHRIGKDAKAAGIHRLPNQRRLVAGDFTKTVIYATRNLEKWQNASDEEIRDQFRLQATTGKGPKVPSRLPDSLHTLQ